MKLWYCENYVEGNYFTAHQPSIEQFYILETGFGPIVEFNEDGDHSSTWDDWDDFSGCWRDKKVFNKDFIKVRVL